MKLAEVDPKLAALDTVPADTDWHAITEPGFTLYGCMDKAQPINRIDRYLAASIDPAVAYLARNTAGIRLRFSTDSPYIALSASLAHKGVDVCPADMTLINCSGFDIYSYSGSKYRFEYAYRPIGYGDKLCDVAPLYRTEMRNFEINFPMFNGVDSLSVGVQSGCKILPAPAQTRSESFIAYGSSITNGGCSNRPGTSYISVLARRLDCDYLNIGLSGRCLAEQSMADYIATLPYSVLLYDYDHNAPNAAHLKQTHERLYRTVRESRPEMPIVIVTMPMLSKQKLLDKGWWTPERHEVIYQTYRNAVNSGDSNVWFVDGNRFFDEADVEDCTYDYVHCNDMGFNCMANKIEPALREALEKAKNNNN